ncbi:hypothetical protein MIZ03_4444 [Rhodoferax lithotrophicus]|uniref:Uncharacterized protein n=1 Tax=Rhodoferax lithotrophicus TaxID=2798804 RepID=A0ABN6DFT5_9BURK|nr:hypothetical protein MIZ03_4444 [Rhodoferax sp. MIZ03]
MTAFGDSEIARKLKNVRHGDDLTISEQKLAHGFN